MARPVSIVTVTHDTYFFVRLLVEKVRQFIGERPYEIVVVDRGSSDGSLEWLSVQGDVRLVRERAARRGHGHGEAAEGGVANAGFEHVVLLDSDAHPVGPEWLEVTVERLDERVRLAGPVFRVARESNPFGRYIHPHFMAFHRSDLGRLIALGKPPRSELDTAEASTIRVLQAGLDLVEHPITFCDSFDVGHPDFPTVSAGVFHAWYGTRLAREKSLVLRETAGAVTRSRYLEPLQRKLREAYALNY